MFRECIDLEKGLERILEKKDFSPLPRYDEREPWEKMDLEVKEYFFKQKECLLNYEYKSLSATKYLKFSFDGNRDEFENEYFEKRKILLYLIILELAEGKGDCLNQIIDGVWNICEESSWVIPAHNNHMQCELINKLPDVTKKDFIDLFSAETGALLAWAYYFFKDEMIKVSPLIVDRLIYEVNKRVNKPYLQYDNMSWMGLDGRRVNNWNPWIVGNCLAAAMLIEADEDKRKQAVLKSTWLLDKFLDQYTREYLDGGCDEGASYWNAAGACLFDCLEMLYQVTEGAIDLYQEELILNIGEYIAKMHVSNGKFINFADGSLSVPLSYPQINRFGKQVHSEYMVQFAKAMGQEEKMPKISENAYFTYRTLQDVLDFGGEKQTSYTIPYKKDIWLENLQVVCARVEETGEGLFVAAKGGHNNESHNHNDIGNFIIYYGDKPILIDPGVETYTAKTFSPLRYEIWTMQSNYHNLPTINGAMQCAGEQYKAEAVSYVAKENETIFSLELKNTYEDKAQLSRFNRSIRLDKLKNKVEIIDEIHTTKEENEYIFNFMTLNEPIAKEKGRLLLFTEGDKSVVLCYGEELEESYETIILEDKKMRNDWKTDKLYRLRLKKVGSNKEKFRFMIEG